MRPNPKEFWSPEQAAVFAAVDKEEVEEQVRQFKEQRAIEEHSRDMLDGQKPVEDPESLRSVSEAFLKRMETECGHKILGLKTVTEDGRRFSPNRLLETALPIPEHIFTHIFAISDVVCNEDATLLYHVRSKRPDIPIEQVPVVQLSMTDIAAIKLDPTCADTGYISNDEAIRLMSYHRLAPGTVVYLRKLASESVRLEPKFLQTGTLDICIFPNSQLPAVAAVTLQKLDEKTQGGAVRLCLPPETSEFFAEQVLVAILKHFVFVLFTHNELAAEDADDVFQWSYVYAIEHRVFPDHSHEILFIVGKRTNDSAIARVRKRAHDMRRDADAAFQEMAREKIQALASANGQRIAELATYRKKDTDTIQ